MLQKQNEGLHQSLLKTAVRMDCLGEEFMNNQQLLEVDLQRTRIELYNLTESFTRLQDNCSSAQQTNELHSVVSSALCKTDHHFQSVDAINETVLPISPALGQEQPLGPVPEEEESDWSEMGEETSRFILTRSDRGHAWKHREGQGLIASESGDEEFVGRHPSRSLQIPHLQFTIHHEILPVCQTNANPASFKNASDGMSLKHPHRATTGLKIESTNLIRAASLEEIPVVCQYVLKELRGTDAMVDPHHPGNVDAVKDSDNEIIHHWKTSDE
ncbi:hypothetical protein LDENG_00139760 [Lucifuga dentata]|nr:hypothetical protein LDENG_00139760 [Lucifuga dentata]